MPDRTHPVSVFGAYVDVALRREPNRVWIARGDHQGELIETRGSSELSALSRWQALARARTKIRQQQAADPDIMIAERRPRPHTGGKGRNKRGAEMSTRIATCRCGQLQAIARGEPVRVSVCHCLDCQKRSGSAFAAQARWPNEDVTLTGDAKTWVRIADSGHKATYQFCPHCGSTVTYVIDGWPGVTAIPLGAFADPDFPAPKFSVYEHRKHAWTTVLGDDVTHSSTPRSPGRPTPGPI